MTSPNLKTEQNIIKKINATQKERELIVLEESELYLKEAELWYELKRDFFSRKKSGSWALFLDALGAPLFTVEFKVALYKKWIIELGYTFKDLTGINSRKLHRAIPHVNSRKDAEQILKQARTLSFDSFLKWLKAEF